MCATYTGPSVSAVAEPLHAAFLVLLPRIEAYARVYFRDTRCADRRQER